MTREGIGGVMIDIAAQTISSSFEGKMDAFAPAGYRRLSFL